MRKTRTDGPQEGVDVGDDLLEPLHAAAKDEYTDGTKLGTEREREGRGGRKTEGEPKCTLLMR